MYVCMYVCMYVYLVLLRNNFCEQIAVLKLNGTSNIF